MPAGVHHRARRPHGDRRCRSAGCGCSGASSRSARPSWRSTAARRRCLLARAGHRRRRRRTIARLVDRTEGWPVALSPRRARPRRRRGATAELVDELHRRPPLPRRLPRGGAARPTSTPDIASFLMEASCFERISGSLCDDVLQRQRLGRAARGPPAPQPARDPARRPPASGTGSTTSGGVPRSPSWRGATRPAAPPSTAAPASGATPTVTPTAPSRTPCSAATSTVAESMVLRWFGPRRPRRRRTRHSTAGCALFPDGRARRSPAADDRRGAGPLRRRRAGRGGRWLPVPTRALPDRHPDDAHGLVGPAMRSPLARSIIAPLPPAEMATEARYVYDHVGRGDGHPLVVPRAGAPPPSCSATSTRRCGGSREGADTDARPTARRGATASPTSPSSTSSTADGRRRRPRPVGRGACSADAVAVAIGGPRPRRHTCSSRRTPATPSDVEADRLLCRQHLDEPASTSRRGSTSRPASRSPAPRVIRGDRVEATALARRGRRDPRRRRPAPSRVAEQLGGAAPGDRRARDRSQRFGPVVVDDGRAAGAAAAADPPLGRPRSPTACTCRATR